MLFFWVGVMATPYCFGMVNLFMQGGEAMKARDEFGDLIKKYLNLQIVLRDDQPRGVGTS